MISLIRDGDKPLSFKEACLALVNDYGVEYMLDRIPVLPPIYRPISTHNGLTMVADSNYLYAQLLDARDDERESKKL